MTTYNLDFPRASGSVSVQADFRSRVEDFYVEEILGFEPCGEGEHVYLHVEKRGQNTDWVARQIARLAGVKPMDVGYCGLKDRHAVTRQWFSVYLPRGEALTWQALNSDTVTLLAQDRHSHKLRRGQHRGNRFIIVLRNLSGEIDPEQLQQVLRQGVPNYFGEQRFGHDGNNLHEADLLLSGNRKIKQRRQRGLIISAARSWLFNQVLAARVKETGKPGSPNWFEALQGETETEASGPLWGRGRPLVQGEVLALESRVLAPWQRWCDGLEHGGLKQERRPLRVKPCNGKWETLESHGSWPDLRLSFELPPGCYATAVLRELVQLNNRSTPQLAHHQGPTTRKL